MLVDLLSGVDFNFIVTRLAMPSLLNCMFRCVTENTNLMNANLFIHKTKWLFYCTNVLHM